MMLVVIKADYIKDYTILLYFNDGAKKTVNLESSLTGPIFQPLKDIEFFKDFSIKFNTIEWKNGADMAPEYLYEIGE